LGFAAFEETWFCPAMAAPEEWIAVKREERIACNSKTRAARRRFGAM